MSTSTLIINKKRYNLVINWGKCRATAPYPKVCRVLPSIQFAATCFTCYQLILIWNQTRRSLRANAIEVGSILIMWRSNPLPQNLVLRPRCNEHMVSFKHMCMKLQRIWCVSTICRRNYFLFYSEPRETHCQFFVGIS